MREVMMHYGFYLPEVGPSATPENLVHIAKRGDELGFYCFVVGDHIIIPKRIESRYPYSVDGVNRVFASGDYYEQLTLLSFLAGLTRRIRLVPSVMIVPHRNPIVTAKALATLDVLSQGRVILGVGVGWNKQEFEALGIPPFEERGFVTDEYIRVFKELWTSDNPSFEGKYCRFHDVLFSPKPVQKPHIPIWIGGNSKRAVRRAAELGNAWHPVGAIPAAPLEPDELAADIELLTRYAEKAGRNPDNIQIAMKVPLYDPDRSVGPTQRRRFTGRATQIIDDIHTYARLGVDCLIFDARCNSAAESIERLEYLAQEIIAHA